MTVCLHHRLWLRLHFFCLRNGVDVVQNGQIHPGGRAASTILLLFAPRQPWICLQLAKAARFVRGEGLVVRTVFLLLFLLLFYQLFGNFGVIAPSDRADLHWQLWVSVPLTGGDAANSDQRFAGPLDRVGIFAAFATFAAPVFIVQGPKGNFPLSDLYRLNRPISLPLFIWVFADISCYHRTVCAMRSSILHTFPFRGSKPQVQIFWLLDSRIVIVE